MQIQQAIIVIMLTAVVCIFVGMISQSMFPDGANDHGLARITRVVIFGFVLLPWVFVITITDLYISQARLTQDVATYMKCS